MQKLKLANQPIWTISNKDKLPIDPQTSLAQRFSPAKYQPQLAAHELEKTGHTQYWGNAAHDPEHTLVTLDQLFAEPKTPPHAYALHLRETDHFMVIDAEKDFDPKIKPLLRYLPYVYAEHSRHGGYHFIVPIPDIFYNDPIYQTVPLKSTYKIGTTLDDHSGVEIFFYNHYLTFTENQLKFTARNPQDKSSIQAIQKLFDYLLNQTNTQIINHNDQPITTKDLNANELMPADDGKNTGSVLQAAARTLMHHGLSDYNRDEMVRLSKLYNDPHFAGDAHHKLNDKSQSGRDFAIVLNLTHKVVFQMSKHYVSHPFSLGADSVWMTDLNHPDPDNMDLAYNPTVLFWAIYYLSTKYLKPRAKLTKILQSQQLTYQQLDVKKALDFYLYTRPPKGAIEAIREHGYEIHSPAYDEQQKMIQEDAQATAQAFAQPTTNNPNNSN